MNPITLDERMAIARGDHDVTGQQGPAANGTSAHVEDAVDSSGVLPSPREPVKVARELMRIHHTDGTGAALLRRWRGGWWEWRGARWVELEESAVLAHAYRFTEHAVYIDGDKPKPWAPNRYKVADLLGALSAVSLLGEEAHPPTWTGDPTVDTAANEFVSVTNGLLHVPTRTLYEHTPAMFNTVAVPFAYDPKHTAPTRWLEFLSELWPDDGASIAALREFFGYVISGRTDLHKILLLIGPTRAGKGVIARILKDLVGKGNYAGPTLASLGTNFGLEPLVGKPLAIVSDARLGGGANVHQVVERLLSVSGEDMLTIDRKYRQHWTGTLPTRFLVVSNELPRFGDASGAIARRFVVLALTESWLGRENTRLTDELRKELPGILNWALDGLESLQRQGKFTEPDFSCDAIAALEDLVSPVAAFIRDHCDKGPFEVDIKVLFDTWKAWAEDNGHRPGSSQTFGRDLRAVVPGLRTVRPKDVEGSSRPRKYVGVGLKKR